MKGYELCREVKTGYPETKVIGTSGAIGEERREFIGQYRKAGADAFIEKPFELKDVLSKIKELLGE
ncbi:response regulator [Candidatus Woesearchaeota archaeon]|nr:response regulator [Candidatus Woesearchaeota archaeon]